MKNKVIVCFSILLSFLIGCKGEAPSKQSKANNIDYYQFFKFDLSPYDIAATIMLPDETVGIGTSFLPEMKHKEADFLWELNIGPNFSFLIEDFGDVKELVKTHKAKILDKQQSIYPSANVSSSFQVSFLFRCQKPSNLVFATELIVNEYCRF